MSSFLVEAILPVFALVGVGGALGHWRRTDPAPLVDVCLYLLMPLLMFTALVRDPLSAPEAARYVGWYLAYTAAAWLTGTLLARLAGWDRPSQASVCLALMGINVGSYGVPVVLFAIGESALSGSMVLLACSNATAGSIGVYVAAAGRATPRQAFYSVFRLPLVYAVGLALVCTGFDLRVPAAPLELAYAVGMCGPMLSLVVLGLQLARVDWGGTGGGQLLPTVGVKLVLAPVLGILLALALADDPEVLRLLALMACLPTAINGLLLSVRFDARPDLLGAVIFITTLASPLAMLFVLAWLG